MNSISEVITVDDLVVLIISYIPGCCICSDSRNPIVLTNSMWIYNKSTHERENFVEIDQLGGTKCDFLNKLSIPTIHSPYTICPYHFIERYVSLDYVHKCSECDQSAAHVLIDDNRLVCNQHVGHSRIINFTSKCDKELCLYKANYLNLEDHKNYCSVHKGKHSTLHVEDYRLDIKSHISCHNCKKQIEHYFTCTCGIVRCKLCMHIYSFVTATNEISCAECRGDRKGHHKLYLCNSTYGRALLCDGYNTTRFCESYIDKETYTIVCHCTSHSKHIKYNILTCCIAGCKIGILDYSSIYCEFHVPMITRLKRKMDSFLKTSQSLLPFFP
jgi:hypothetical protein